MKTIFINGSPKKNFSASAYFLSMQKFFVKGEKVREVLRNEKDHDRILDALKDGDAVVFCLPLYVDCVPSHVLSFLKDMERFCLENHLKLNVYVIANNGYIEGVQSEALLQVFRNFCIKSGLIWGGGIGIGGGVMLNVMRIVFCVQVGVLWYTSRMGSAINKGSACGEKYTRILIPSFIFILFADIFFVIFSIFKGGMFRGLLSRK